ncbi:hypothetical protein CDAR_471261 [Caerostris darwini]|uniref:Ribosomal protein L5 n=1 Tax=Caerostris darwini TaxID=1538125 RepID=A0AAV4QPN4_9ARAC|nr:hypothetical protein CDAR_471261 [Caerostris darwini]
MSQVSLSSPIFLYQKTDILATGNDNCTTWTSISSSVSPARTSLFLLSLGAKKKKKSHFFREKSHCGYAVRGFLDSTHSKAAPAGNNCENRPPVAVFEFPYLPKKSFVAFRDSSVLHFSRKTTVLIEGTLLERMEFFTIIQKQEFRWRERVSSNPPLKAKDEVVDSACMERVFFFSFRSAASGGGYPHGFSDGMASTPVHLPGSLSEIEVFFNQAKNLVHLSRGRGFGLERHLRRRIQLKVLSKS